MTTINNVNGSTSLDQTSSLGATSGAGASQRTSATGNLPNVPTDALLNEVLGSLPDLPATIGGMSLDQLMKALADEARRQGVKSAVDGIEVKGEQLKQLGEEKLEQIQKQIEENKKKSFWQKFLDVFKVIGAVIGAIASVATIAAGAITANPLLIAAGVMGAVMAIDSTVSMATDGKVSLAAGLAKLGQALGMDEKASQIFATVFMAAYTVVAVGLSFGGAAAANGANIAANAGKAMNVLQKGATIANIGNGITQIGSGSATIALAVINHQIAQLKADSLDIDAILEQLRASQKDLEEFFESELNTANELMEKVHEIVDDCNSTQTAILANAPACA